MIRAITLLLGIAACEQDESISAFVDVGSVWQLTSIGGVAFSAKATLVFPKPGQVTGQAPCNNYSAAQTAPYPWFELGPIIATKRACPDLAAEGLMMKTLQSMTISEVSGDVLVLSDDTGFEMLFQRSRP